MSRRSVMWRKKYGATWETKKTSHSSQNGGSLDGLIPSARVISRGKKRIYSEATGGFTPGKPSNSVVTEPMKPEKEARIRAMFAVKRPR